MKCVFKGHDLNQKIDKTICRYKGVPYYCRYTNDISVTLYKLTDMGQVYETIQVDDEDFDVSSLPLGYYQEGNIVFFAERRPMRRWKQGIDEAGVNIFRIKPEVIAPKYIRRTLYTQGFIDSVMGRFPNINNAVDFLRKQPEDYEIAISRDIALHWVADLQIIHVYYRMRTVGFIPANSMTVFVPSNDMGWVVTKYLSCFHWDIK